jgi:hypothetical protein
MTATDPLAEAGLLVLDLTAPDEQTALVAMEQLQQLWRTSGIVPVRRVPGRPGVTVRLYADLRPR